MSHLSAEERSHTVYVHAVGIQTESSLSVGSQFSEECSSIMMQLHIQSMEVRTCVATQALTEVLLHELGRPPRQVMYAKLDLQARAVHACCGQTMYCLEDDSSC